MTFLNIPKPSMFNQICKRSTGELWSWEQEVEREMKQWLGDKWHGIFILNV